jgi:hypothetical protein
MKTYNSKPHKAAKRRARKDKALRYAFYQGGTDNAKIQ